MNKGKNKIAENNNKQSTPIIIKGISFFLIFGSCLAILFYLYIFVFNIEILNNEISIIKNPFVSPKIYLLIEVFLFILLIYGATIMLYLKRYGIYLVLSSLIVLISINYVYFQEIDWLNIGMLAIIMLINSLNWKYFK